MITLFSNQLTIRRGQTLVLSENEVNTTWSDGDSNQLIFNVSDVTNGFFSEGQATTPIFSFTQQQVRNGDIHFTHQGGDAAPFYWLNISQLNETTYIPTIYFTGYCLRESVLVTDQGLIVYPKIAVSNDSIFVAWEDRTGLDGSAKGILSRAYNAGLTPINNSSVVNIYTSGEQDEPDMISLPAGGYVVSWASLDQISAHDSYFRFYDVNGNPTTNEILINTYNTVGNQEEPRLTVLNNGNLMVVMRSHYGSPVYQTDGQVFDVLGNPVGGAFRVNTRTTIEHLFPSIATLKNNHVVVAWAEAGSPPETNPHGILRGRIISDTGAGISNEFIIDSGRAVMSLSAIAPLDTGGFVICWIASDNLSVNEAYNLHIRIFDASGNPLTSRSIVNDPAQRVTYPVLASFDNQSKFIVTWSWAGLNAKVYYSDGRIYNDIFSLSTYGGYSDLYGFNDNRLLVAWGSSLRAAYIEEEQAPALVTHRMALQEGEEVLLSTNEIVVTDDDTVTLYVTEVHHGQFEQVNFPSVAIIAFNQSAVDNKEIVFIHTGEAQAPDYCLYASDGYLQTATVCADITFERRFPVLINNALLVSGTNITLTSANIRASAAPSSGVADSDLEIIVGNVRSGFFSYVNTLTPIHRFKQQAIFDEVIQFIYAQDKQTPRYDVVVGDGTLASLPQSATITLSDAPTVEHDVVVIYRDSAVVFDTAILNTTIETGVLEDVLFMATDIENGWFIDISQGNQTVTTFTYAQLAQEDIALVQDGGYKTPSYVLHASYNGFVSAPVLSNIHLTVGNETVPRIVHRLYIEEGQAVVLQRKHLYVIDELGQRVGGNIEFTVEYINHGQFNLVGQPGVELTTFRQTQLVQGDVVFIHDNSEHTPSYQITAKTGLLESAPLNASVVFKRINEPPELIQPLSDYVFYAGEDFAFSVNNSFRDPEDGQLYFTAALYGGGSLPLTWDFDGVWGRLSGVADTLGATQVNITAYEPQGLSVSGDLTVTTLAQPTIASTEQSTFQPTTAVPSELSTQLGTALSTLTIPIGRPGFKRAHLVIVDEHLVLSPREIQAVSVPGLPSKHLEIRVEFLLGGHFEKLSPDGEGMPVAQFTQAEIDSGRIQFVLDGTGRTPSFDLWVKDTLNSLHSLPVAADVQVVGAPRVCIEDNTLQRGGRMDMAGVLDVCERIDNATRHRRLLSEGTELSWVVEWIDNAAFEGAAQSEALYAFNQSRIDSGDIWLVSDGGSDAPRYGVSVHQGNLRSAVEAVNVPYVSDTEIAPSIRSNRLLILSEGPTSLTTEYLVYEKGASARVDIQFNEVGGGYFSLRTQLGMPRTQFNESSLLNGDIVFNPMPYDAGAIIGYTTQILGQTLNSAHTPAKVIDVRWELFSGGEKVPNTTDSSTNTALIAGAVAGGAVALLLGGLGLFACRRQCGRGRHDATKGPVEMATGVGQSTTASMHTM